MKKLKHAVKEKCEFDVQQNQNVLLILVCRYRGKKYSSKNIFKDFFSILAPAEPQNWKKNYWRKQKQNFKHLCW